MKKLYFLGPTGTFSEFAAQKVETIIPNLELNPVSTIAKVIDMVDNDEDCIGVLPIENLIDGIVRQTVDNIYTSNVKIQAQFELKITHCLVSKTSDITKIKHIISHPQALAQCQRYILENFDEQIDVQCVNSTAHAGFMLEENDETFAAITSYELAQKLNLNIIATDIADLKDNKTRFVIISQKDLALGNKQRTSIVFNTKNEPGALLHILEIFNSHNLNLVYLESRPSRDVFGEYNFFTDIDNGYEEVAEVLDKIAWKCNFYKLLGSYTRIE
ncbi:prephenate dehydratase [bacterium]|nr:prephenate dehydratase [bacterium]